MKNQQSKVAILACEIKFGLSIIKNITSRNHNAPNIDFASPNNSPNKHSPQNIKLFFIEELCCLKEKQTPQHPQHKQIKKAQENNKLEFISLLKMEVKQIIKYLLAQGFHKAILVGNVEFNKIKSYNSIPELTKIIARIQRFANQNILTISSKNALSIISNQFNKCGLELIALGDIYPKYIASLKDNELQLSGGYETFEQMKTQTSKSIKLAQSCIEALAKYDLGQSLAVMDAKIIGIEDLSGTDSLIKRSKDIIQTTLQNPELNEESNNPMVPAFIYKAAKKNQNLTDDMPVIGIETIKNMHEARFNGIVVKEAEVFIDQKPEFLKLIKKLNFFYLTV